MKKIFSLLINVVLLCAVLVTCCLTGCERIIPQQGFDEKVLQITATIFPEYDWVMNILGDNPANADVCLLLDNGTDLHSFQPSVHDILQISSSDLFIYVGGESDEWIEDVLKEAVNKNMEVINLMDVLEGQVREEEVVEGMQAGRPGSVHGSGNTDDSPAYNNSDTIDAADTVDAADAAKSEDVPGDEEEPEYDEHVWLSLRNAAVIVDSIEAALTKLDPANTQIYKENAAAYKEKLYSLDKQYEAVISESDLDILLFGDRFPFRYMTDDYGLSYYAAFTGCSAETEASFETIVFLINKADELSLPAVMTIDRSDPRLAQTIVRSTQSKDQEILTLNSLQSVTSQDIQNGVTYLSIMEDNLSVLEKALNYTGHLSPE